MRGLLKFILLAFSFCLKISAIDFANTHISFYDGRSSFPSDSIYKKVNDVEFLSNSYLRIGDYIFSYSTSGDNLFNLFLKNGDGFYFNKNRNSLQFYDSSHEKYTVYCESNAARGCSFEASTSYPVPVEFSYFKVYDLSYIVTCPSDQNFNTITRQCQKCPDGQSWNPSTNSCFMDCTDEKTNKWGWSDGSCTDCSASKTTQDVYRCFCGSLGLGVPPTITDVGVIGKPGYFKGQCADGNMFEYKDPEFKPDPKPDDNKTKPDDPNPNPDDNNKTKPDDPNNPNQGGSNQGGNQGGNNGGNQGNNTNPNPDPKPNPKPGNNDGNNNNDGDKNKDADVKFNPGDFDYSDKKREYDDFKNKYSKALDDVLKDFDGFKQGVDQFISNVRGKGLSDVNKHSKPTTCVKKYEIDFFGYKTSIEFDFCKVAATVSGAFYYIFYAFFFYCFLILIVKILLFAF